MNPQVIIGFIGGFAGGFAGGSVFGYTSGFYLTMKKLIEVSEQIDSLQEKEREKNITE
jgi:hypothetical protein